MRPQITAIILGVVVLMIGMIVAAILDSQAAFSGDTAVRCRTGITSGSNAYSGILISKTAAQCEATGGLVAGDFRAPEPTSAQLTTLNAEQNNSGAGGYASGTNIASFAGAAPLNNLIPTLIRVVLVMVGVGMIGIGGLGVAGRGPLARA